MRPLIADNIGPANFGVILVVKLYCPGHMGITELNCPLQRGQMYCVLYLEGPLRGILL